MISQVLRLGVCTNKVNFGQIPRSDVLPETPTKNYNSGTDIMALYNKSLLLKNNNTDVQFSKFIKKYNEQFEVLDKNYYSSMFQHTLSPSKQTEEKLNYNEIAYNNLYTNKNDYCFLQRLKNEQFKDPTYRNQINYILPLFQEKSLFPQEYLKIKAMEAKIFAMQSDDMYSGDEIVKLANMRNDFAKKLGYKNFFDYKIRTVYKKTPEEFLSDCQKIHDASKKYTHMRETFSERLIDKMFNKKRDDVPVKYDVNKSNYEEIFGSVKSQYDAMGWDISSYPIKINKVERPINPICFAIDPSSDIRIIIPPLRSKYQANLLSHEVGHAIYSANIDRELPYFLKDSPNKITTEAFAIMMENLSQFPNHKTEWTTSEKVTLAKKMNYFIAQAMFEKELYECPNQNLDMAWNKLFQKYCNYSRPFVNNRWDRVYHYVSAPVYIPNYIYGEVLADQMYDTASKKLGGQIQKNKNSAEYFRKNLFAKGALYSPEKTVKNITDCDNISIDKYINKFIIKKND